MFDWTAFFTFTMLSSITPGPNTILSMSNGNRRGFFRGLPLNLGIWCGFTIMMVGCALLTSVLAAWIPMIKKPMLFVGAGYLLWLAWKSLRRSAEITDRDPVGEHQFLTGFTMQFINPKVMLYGIMSYEAYVLPVFEGNYPVLLGFSVILSTIGFVNGLLWSACGDVLRVLFSKHAKIINTAMAVMLVWCAVKMLLS